MTTRLSRRAHAPRARPLTYARNRARPVREQGRGGCRPRPRRARPRRLSPRIASVAPARRDRASHPRAALRTRRAPRRASAAHQRRARRARLRRPRQRHARRQRRDREHRPRAQLRAAPSASAPPLGSERRPRSSTPASSASRATRTGRGYWLVAADGGVFAFGDAALLRLDRRPPLERADRRHRRHPDGRGYWLVGADGGVFAFGDAALPRLDRRPCTLARADRRASSRPPTATATGSSAPTAASSPSATPHFHGSAGEPAPREPDRRRGRDARPGTATGSLGADGGVFAFGDAHFHGSRPDPQHPAVGIAAAPNGNGYWVAHADGSVGGFGDSRRRQRTSTLDATGPHPNTVGIAASAARRLLAGAGRRSTRRRRLAQRSVPRVHTCARVGQAGGYQAVSPGGTYRGAYQFDRVDVEQRGAPGRPPRPRRRRPGGGGARRPGPRRARPCSTRTAPQPWGGRCARPDCVRRRRSRTRGDVPAPLSFRHGSDRRRPISRSARSATTGRGSSIPTP